MKYNIFRNSLGGKTKMKTVRVVEYIDLEGENHTDELFFMRITSEKLVKRAALYDKVIEN